MTQTDLFGVYVRDRLDGWGEVFAYHRDRERLGYKSKDMLQVLIEHKGEMPPKNVGFKPLEICPLAQQIEDLVRELFRENKPLAWVLRAYYCGKGRRAVERYEFFKALTGRDYSRAQYFDMLKQGQDWVRAALIRLARADER